MKILIDSREQELYNHIIKIHEQKNCPSIIIEKTQLDLGDSQIINNNNEIDLIIERKTLSDLGSSIHDGRWSEQKERCIENYPNKLFYIIQIDNFSDILNYSNPHSYIKNNSILSATINLLTKHYIPYLYLNSMELIANYIYLICLQYHKKYTIYKKTETETKTESYSEKYISSILPKKQKNMSPTNYFLFCLQGIPSISNKTASNISSLFDNSFSSFYDFLRDHPLDDLSMLYKMKFNRFLNKDVLMNLNLLLKEV